MNIKKVETRNHFTSAKKKKNSEESENREE